MRLWPFRRQLSLLSADAWRWAVSDETWDVYVPAPEYGDGCERGLAPWRVRGNRTEKTDAEIEWVRVEPENMWLPALSHPDGPTTVFAGCEIHMVPVPAGGIALGRIER